MKITITITQLWLANFFAVLLGMLVEHFLHF